jgi:hypothetical protein
MIRHEDVLTKCGSMLGGSLATAAWRVLRLRLWRIAANTSNKLSWTADSGWSSNWGRGGFRTRLTIPHRKKLTFPEMLRVYIALDLDTLGRQNMDMRFGTWNIRSLYRAGSLMTVSRELSRHKLGLVRVQDRTCWRIHIFL